MKAHAPHEAARARRARLAITAVESTAGWARSHAERERIHTELRPSSQQSRMSEGSRSDRLERETDRAADLVVNGPAATGALAVSSIAAAPSAPVIQRACAACGTPNPDGASAELPGRTCEKCGVQRAALSMSKPGDALEVEADLAAVRAMRFLGGGVKLRAPAPLVQRVATAPSSTHPGSAALLAQLGAGRSFEGATRGRMEAAFGSSFAGVRVHDDAAAAALSRRLDARAFTLGAHIAFSSGAYQPGTSAGDRLLAHELAHTIQQRSAAPMVARAGAGGCAEPPENVDEEREESSRAGSLAHRQIQQFFQSAISTEQSLPRATKRLRRLDCPDATVPDGRMDFFLAGLPSEIGEIKPGGPGGSARGERAARADVRHYIKRARELVGRLTDGVPCRRETPRARADEAWDDRWYRGLVRARGIKPVFAALDRVVPPVGTRLGPFLGNPRKDLFCQRRSGGAVLYWCTKRKEPEEKKQPQAVAKPAEKEEQTKKRVPIRIVDVEAGFSDMANRFPDRDAPPGRDWVVVVDGDLHDLIIKQYQRELLEKQLRPLRIDVRGVPVIQLGAPLVGLAPYLAVIEGALLLVMVALAGTAVAAVAVVPVVAAEIVPEAAAEFAAEVAAEFAPEAAAEFAPEAAAEFAAETAAEIAPETTVATGAIDGTSTGIQLTVYSGARAGAATAVTGGRVALASLAKNSAAAAALIATLLAADKNANAAGIIAPLLDKPLVGVIDVTGRAVPKLGSEITVQGKKFNVVMQLSTRGVTPR